MARITLFPKDGTGSVDGYLATDVNYTGIDPDIRCVQWYDTIGSVEYISDPITGFTPPNETIESLTPYQPYVDNCVTIIDAYLNPYIVYCTDNGVVYGGLTYDLGAEIVIDTPNPVPPAESTTQVPPTPNSFQQLYWYNSAWVISSFPPDLSLSAAKEVLTEKVNTSASVQVDLQSRTYSVYSLVVSADPGALPTADYYGLDLSTYQGYIDGEVLALTTEINAATTTQQLYNFDWVVEGTPNI
jgi:hypothetical protein